VLAYVDASCAYVRRVLTIKVDVTASLAEFLGSVDPLSTAILAGRRLVVEAGIAGVGAGLADPRKLEEARGRTGALLALIASR
jgi:hypothetical protein